MNMPLFDSPVEKLELRDYQDHAISVLRKSFQKGHKRVVLQLPTGAGKTIIAVQILKLALSRGLRCAFVADRLTLIDQTSKVFDTYGIMHGVIQGMHPRWDPLAPVQLCSIQTLARREVKDFDLILIDECHSLHKTHKALLQGAGSFVGLSATPWARSMGKYFDDICSPIRMRDLIDKGFLLDFRVYGPPTISTEGLKVVAGDYQKQELSERVDKRKITGDIVDHWFEHARHMKTIVFCVDTGHAGHVAQTFQRKGIKAISINCYMRKAESGDEVKVALKAFAANEIQILCSVDLVSKGFDQPDVECLVLARPTKSQILHVQQVGRGLRIHEGLKECLILDHAGNHERLGFADEIEKDYLNDQDELSKKEKEKEKVEPLPKVCPSCDFLKPAMMKKCPACGFETQHIREVEAEQGRLEEIKRSKESKTYTLEEKRAFLGGLNKYAMEKGYRCGVKRIFGWSIHKYKEKFGCQPTNKIDWNTTGPINDDVRQYIRHCNIKYAKSKEK